MARYQIWDKASTIYTLTGESLTPEQWLARYPWAGIEGVKMIVGGGVINGTVALEFSATVEMYKRMGAEVDEATMTDAEILAAIETFEDKRTEDIPSAEERIAAALEYQAMMTMPDMAASGSKEAQA